ncbi:uncharacterized protein [Primulina eburnea]|uniref:uncharacterized protein n=1 Tax=Primulina eburnea TaxID=1245227 RepID=UPI003C6C511C
MPPKRKAVEGEDISSSRVVDEFSKLLKVQANVHGEQIQQLLRLQNPLQGRAMEWVKAIETIFEYLHVEDNDRFSCAVFLLTKTASIWWEATKVAINVQTLKWSEFKELFYDKYFSNDVKTRKVKEFLELKLGNLNVNDYILKFEEECLFVHFIASNEKDRGENFMRSLRAEIRRDVRISKAATQSSPLIDTGAMHSFMSAIFMRSLGIAPIFEPLQYNIVFPLGDVICPTSMMKACPIQVNEETLFSDLIVIPTIEFDVLLGMDWISSHRAIIDCVEKMVRFPIEEGDNKVFKCSGTMLDTSFISFLKVNKMLLKGCQGFLESVMDVSKEYNMDVNDIEIVREYSDVFVDDVPGFPSDREVEFVIDFEPGNSRISKAPYRMAPTEMKELKNQLQELLDKGFIRPSSSPWGEQVLGMVFSNIDLRSGYHQLKVKEDDIPKIAFRTRYGHYEILTRELHREHLRTVLQKLRDNKIYAKLKKCGYYRRFIADLSKIALPLTTLARKTVKFEWTNECQQSFQELKDKLTSAPRGKVIAYASLQLKDYEKTYPTHILELAAVVFALKICYHHGKANVVADALTRKSGVVLSSMIQKHLLLDFQRNEIALVEKGTIARLSALVIRPTLNDMIKHGQHNDKQLLEMKSKAEASLGTVGKSLHRALGTKLAFKTTHHPQSYGQSERVIQILEDMLRACIINFSGRWDLKLPLVEFTYNNSYQSSIGMAPYEALYGIRCRRSHLFWDEVGQRKMIGIELVPQMVDVVALIREKIKTAQSLQKSYAVVRRRPLSFEIGDHVVVKIAPLNGVMRFGKKGKLSPRFIGIFEILDRIGERAYRVSLPPDLDRVHNVFQVSMLRKYVSNLTHVIHHEPLDLMPNLSYHERAVQIQDRKVKVLRNKEIGIVKVLWSNHVIEKATWEPEEEMKQHYPDLFTS